MGLKPLFTFRKKEKYFNKQWQKILIHCSYFNFMFRCRISFSITPSRNQTEDLLVARNETYLLLATKSCLVVWLLQCFKQKKNSHSSEWVDCLKIKCNKLTNIFIKFSWTWELSVVIRFYEKPFRLSRIWSRDESSSYSD